MKTIVFYLSLSSLFFSLALFAQEAQKQNSEPVAENVSEATTTNKFNSKNIEFSAAYAIQNLTNPSEEEIDANGFSITAGKIFHLSPIISTTSAITYNRSSLDIEGYEKSQGTNLPDGFELGGNLSDFNLSQRFAYNLNAGKLIIRPFTKLGIGLGSMNIFNEFNNDFINFRADVDMSYTRYSAALGTEVVLNGGIAPFVKYELSRVQFGDSADITAKINGEKIEEEVDITDIATEEKRLSSGTILIGLGYYF